MKEKEIKKTEQLVRKFFDGMTTDREEQQLYGIFKRGDLPPQLAKYRDTLTAFGLISHPAATGRARTVTLRRAVAGIAAAVLIVFGIMLYMNVREERTLAAMYEGSYVIENGQRTDDLSEIKDDIQAALSDARTIERNAHESSVVSDAEQDVLGSISDPDTRREVMEMLK